MNKPNFKLWLGVVEDRADPEYLGRYRVRVLGYHTANRDVLPTSDLPWAVAIMPVTSASVSGISDTPSLVEGSTVVGFYTDEDEQIPIIMGSLAGMPLQRIDDSSIGFSDPNHKYPRDGEDAGYNALGEPDISRLARGKDAEKHASLISKRQNISKKIPRAVSPSVPSVGEDKPSATYTREFWDEPHPRFGSTAQGTYTTAGSIPTFEAGKTSVYPFNRVIETESGHVFEVDDTPGNGRIHEYHNSGTFSEIQSDGKKITKIVGDEYEITLGDKKVTIQGSCDVTIGGNVRLYVQGDLYTEVEGNQLTTVRGDRVTKIGGNDLTEILTDSNTQINGSRGLRISGNDSETVTGTQTHSVGGTKTTTVGGNVSETHAGKMNTSVADTYNILAVESISIASGENVNIGSGGDLIIKSNGKQEIESISSTQLLKSSSTQTLTSSVTNMGQNVNVTGTLDASVEVKAGGADITLTGHKHLGVQTGGGTSGVPTM